MVSSGSTCRTSPHERHRAPPDRPKTLASFVATFGLSIALVRAWDEADARDRIRHHHPGFVIGDDEISVRPATTDDRHLLDVIPGGSAVDRTAWADHLTSTT